MMLNCLPQFGQVKKPDDVERKLKVVNSAILYAYHKVCPKWRILRRDKVPWWNHELKVLRAKANEAFHRACQSKLEEDWQAHREARRAFKKEFCQCKRTSWLDFCAKTESIRESARLYKLLVLSLIHI